MRVRLSFKDSVVISNGMINRKRPRERERKKGRRKGRGRARRGERERKKNDQTCFIMLILCVSQWMYTLKQINI